jgi:hypothetical protein
MARQNAEKRCFLSKQNGHCIQQVTGLPGIFPHVFAHEVPALLARKSRGPLVTGVADELPERVRSLIFLDAFVPENNEW